MDSGGSADMSGGGSDNDSILPNLFGD
jgi:hypothetical protein